MNEPLAKLKATLRFLGGGVLLFLFILLAAVAVGASLAWLLPKALECALLVGLAVVVGAVALGRKRRASGRLLQALAHDDPAWDLQGLRSIAADTFAAWLESRLSRSPAPLAGRVTAAFAAEHARRLADILERPTHHYRLTSHEIVGVDDQPGTVDDHCWAWLEAVPTGRGVDGDTTSPPPSKLTALWRFDRDGDAWLLAESREGALALGGLLGRPVKSAELSEIPAAALSRARLGTPEDEAARGLSLSER